MVAQRVKKFDFVIAPKELAEAMIADLGNGPTTVNGDRASTYFLVARAEEEQGGEVTAALIENKADLEPSEQFYGVHLIDDISMSDCRLLSTSDLETDGLVETLEEVYAGLEKSLSDGGTKDDFEGK